MRAVLDTNVLISSVISTGVPHDIVVKGFSSQYQASLVRYNFLVVCRNPYAELVVRSTGRNLYSDMKFMKLVSNTGSEVLFGNIYHCWFIAVS